MTTELPPPLNDKKVYEYYYDKVGKMAADKHPLFKMGICDAAKLHNGEKPWACMVEGHGIIGMYDSKEEARQRAFW